MKLPLYQIDAFASAVFSGNPAAVCPLERWLPDATMQSIAAENNLAETAFFVPRPAGAMSGAGTPAGKTEYDLRWFTPETEIDLCGHATLASGFVVFSVLEPSRRDVTFHTRSGPLTVRCDADEFSMDFPARPPERCPAPAGLDAMLGGTPREVWRSRDLMAVFDREPDVRALKPSFDAIRALDVFGVIVTAPGSEVDFVSRFFAPLQGVPEDPVTGSAHCTLVPYWAKRLGRPRLRARQISPRGGELRCEDRGDRVTISGRAVKYLEGVIEI
jgi:predicted PhzF superfamily epimerase YddE/YHI9